MKIPLPSEDTLLTASALGAAALGAQIGLAPKTAHDMMSAEPFVKSMEMPYQLCGVALAANAAKDIAWSVRTSSTKTDKRDACKLAGWGWAAGTILHATTVQGKAHDKELALAGTACLGILAATLLAKGYSLDEEDINL